VITSTLNPESLRRGMTLYDDMVCWALDANARQNQRSPKVPVPDTTQSGMGRAE
jgi:hypothetical protein